ncbi:MAG: hypothetical protein AAB358_02690 [Patescibacteria group bacterium]
MSLQVQFEERQTTTFFCKVDDSNMLPAFVGFMKNFFQAMDLPLASIEAAKAPGKAKITCCNREDARKIRRKIKEWNRIITTRKGGGK